MAMFGEDPKGADFSTPPSDTVYEPVESDGHKTIDTTLGTNPGGERFGAPAEDKMDIVSEMESAQVKSEDSKTTLEG